MKKSLIFLSALLTVSIFSCKKDATEATNNNNSYFVNYTEAEKVAKHYNAGHNAFSIKEKEISNYIVYKKGDVITHYAFNYTNGGFMLVSADKRVELCQAYNETENNLVELALLPNGVNGWMDDAQTSVVNVNGSAKESIYNAKRWERFLSIQIPNTKKLAPIELPIEDGSDGCGNGYSEQYELSGVPNWDQGCGYNDFCPSTNNSNCAGSFCNKRPTGCGATAAAEIIRFHKKGTYCDWNNMSTYTGSVPTAQLMKNVGTLVNMQYTCAGSFPLLGASTMTNSFGSYGLSASWTGNNIYDVAYNQIKWGKPVMFSGYEASVTGGANLTKGHIWVAQGVHSYGNNCYGGKQFFMNWGWGGYLNGWYSSLCVSGSCFNKLQKVYTITP